MHDSVIVSLCGMPTQRRPVTTPKVKVQDGVGGTGRPTSSPGSELRGKYPALPPIGASGTATPTKESYEEWKKKYDPVIMFLISKAL